MSGLHPYPEYKPSGLPWLGEVPAHWDVRRCKYVFREIDKRSTTGEETHLSMSQKHGLVPSANLESKTLQSENYIGGKLCEPNDLVLNRLKAHLGVFARAQQAGVISPDYTVLRASNGEDVSYFEHVFKTPACIAELRRSTKGIVEGFWRLYTDDFYNIRVPVPPLDERAAMLRFVAALDAHVRKYIRNRRRLIEVLSEQKQAIINQAVTRGLDPTAPLKPSGTDWLGDVPEHWSVSRLKRLLLQNDGGVWGSAFSDEGTFVLRSTEQTINGHWRIKNPAKRILSQADREATRLIVGDLLVTKSSGSQSHIGKTTIVSDEVAELDCCFSNFMQRLRVRSEYNPVFVWHLLNAPLARQQFGYFSNSTTGLGNLSATIIGSIWIAVPPAKDIPRLLAALEVLVGPVDRAIANAEREIDLIREYRTRLIADVVTGKLDVRHLAPPPGSVVADEPDAIDAEADYDEDLADDEDTELADMPSEID